MTETDYGLGDLQEWATAVNERMTAAIGRFSEAMIALTPFFEALAESVKVTVAGLEPYLHNAQLRATEKGMAFDDYMAWLKTAPVETRTEEFALILAVSKN